MHLLKDLQWLLTSIKVKTSPSQCQSPHTSHSELSLCLDCARPTLASGPLHWLFSCMRCSFQSYSLGSFPHSLQIFIQSSYQQGLPNHYLESQNPISFVLLLFCFPALFSLSHSLLSDLVCVLFVNLICPSSSSKLACQ